jgi:anti-sigma B factor antagonist
MQITERRFGDLSILDVDGRMTRNDGYGSVKKQIGALLADGRHLLLLNLSGVPYMDSTSVGELVSAFITVRNGNGVLKLVGPTERISALLSVAKLDTVFEVYESEADAVHSFSSP